MQEFIVCQNVLRKERGKGPEAQQKRGDSGEGGRNVAVPREVSNYARPEIVSAKLKVEVELGIMEGPFESPSFEDLRVSFLGLVPIKQQSKFHVIHYLLYVEWLSSNEGIDSEACSVTHTSFDMAIKCVNSGKEPC